MPRIHYHRQLIEVPLSDRVYQNTRFKQKAVCRRVTHIQEPDGTFSVEMLTVARCYSDDHGSYGEPLHLLGVPDREIVLRADNDTIVDATEGPQFGAILAIRKPVGDPARLSDLEWEELENSFNRPTMLQGDFFLKLRDEIPVIEAEMIRQHMRAADLLLNRYG